MLGVKHQALVYDIIPSTTAVFSYAIGSRKLSANEQFFVGAQTIVSLLQTTQINSNYMRRLFLVFFFLSCLLPTRFPGVLFPFLPSPHPLSWCSFSFPAFSPPAFLVFFFLSCLLPTRFPGVLFPFLPSPLDGTDDDLAHRSSETISVAELSETDA